MVNKTYSNLRMDLLHKYRIVFIIHFLVLNISAFQYNRINKNKIKRAQKMTKHEFLIKDLKQL